MSLASSGLEEGDNQRTARSAGAELSLSLATSHNSLKSSSGEAPLRVSRTIVFPRRQDSDECPLIMDSGRAASTRNTDGRRDIFGINRDTFTDLCDVLKSLHSPLDSGRVQSHSRSECSRGAFATHRHRKALKKTCRHFEMEAFTFAECLSDARRFR